MISPSELTKLHLKIFGYEPLPIALPSDLLGAADVWNLPKHSPRLFAVQLADSYFYSGKIEAALHHTKHTAAQTRKSLSPFFIDQRPTVITYWAVVCESLSK